MSIEYNIHAEKISNEIFSLITGAIKDSFSIARYSEDGSLWVPSSSPEWIDFSIEKSEKGLFVMSNLNGKDSEKIFSIIEFVLRNNKISYSIEEI